MTTHLETLGTPVTDLDEYAAVRARPTCHADEGSAAPAPESAPPRPQWHRWLVVPTIVAILVAGFWFFGRGTPPTAAATVPVAGSPHPPAGIAGFAELYLAAFLTGSDEATLASFTATPHGPGITPYQRYVANAATVDVRRTADDYWVVTVAADVLPRVDGGYGPGALLHFDVAVVATSSRFLALGTPLPVAPPTATVPYGLYAELREDAGDETAEFVLEFFEAYLGGSGRLPRLATPDAEIAPITPASDVALAVQSVKVGDVGGATWVTAHVTTTDATGLTVPVSVSMRLVATPAGTRVAEILPGPPPLGSMSS